MLKYYILIWNRLLIVLIFVDLINTWRLSDLGINETTTPVKDVTIIKNRAYLSIPRRSRHQTMTLVEAPWPENLSTFEPRLFPSKDLQMVDDCNSLQSVISTDTDLGGQLYVLDMGFGKCPPKVITYDGVTQKKITGFTCDLRKVDGSRLNTIVIDSLAIGGPRAYIGYGPNEGLIIYSAREHNWWFVKLAPPTELIDFHPQKFKIEPEYMALSKMKSTLYFTSSTTNYLFSISTKALRLLQAPEPKYLGEIDREVAKFKVKLEGEKIGPSHGLVCDAHNSVFYFVPRFYVLMRWDSRQPLTAEHHTVVLQSNYTLPNVEEIFIDNQSVWTLLGLPNENGDHCVKVQKL